MANTNQRAKRYRARAVVGKSKQAIGPIGASMKMSSVLMDAITSTRLRNRILKEANRDMGFFWINNFLPLRFTDYAERTLGYKKSKSKKAKKSKVVRSAKGEKFNQKSPLVATGLLAKTAVLSANAHGTPKNVRVSFNQNHALQRQHRNVLQTVPTSEIRDMGKHYEEAFAAIISGEQAKSPRKRRSKRAR